MSASESESSDDDDEDELSSEEDSPNILGLWYIQHTFELFLPIFSLSMTSSSHVTLRSSVFDTTCRWSTTGSSSVVRSFVAVIVCDPDVGVSSLVRSLSITF